jgi:predicted HTH domain antitoxin
MARNPAAAAGDDTEVATVIGLYALGELTLGEAADRLDVSRMEMREILTDAGVDLRLGPRSKREAVEETDVLRRNER